jgi:hypothetical protein
MKPIEVIAFKFLLPSAILLALPSCVQVPPQDPVRYQAALDAASDDDFRHRDRERRSAADAYRASGYQAPTQHYHHQSNNFIGW